MEFSIVIPVYGCREALPELHRRLTEVMKELSDSYEIILVNDACPQNSWEEIEQLCEEDSHVVGLELSRNFGQIRALTAGLDYSTGDWVIVMDCDLQDRPEEIPNLFHKLQEGYDVVFACRKARQDTIIKTSISNLFYKIYTFAANVKYDPAICNFSISSRKVVESYCSMRETHRAFVMYIQWLGFRTATLDVGHDKRFAGNSGYSFKKRIQMAVDILTSQSDKLLKVTVMAGFGLFGFSLLTILVHVVRYFALDVQPGYSSIISSVFLMGGLTISTIGIVGVYVGNIFMEVKHRPLYVVRTVLHKQEEKSE